ncbi:hypothetical protein BAE44_0023444 [Dichanthelium oligosanthes]|uniref:F-box domain-containing protein n=1 Tax=Dichanthelium oligosanthes TaxID=888268 RepID=A0A1E5URM6_9POAL|nr:hypothetical protein BAE44_0023444 [Dichanthelium oligosanthes]
MAAIHGEHGAAQHRTLDPKSKCIASCCSWLILCLLCALVVAALTAAVVVSVINAGLDADAEYSVAVVLVHHPARGPKAVARGCSLATPALFNLTLRNPSSLPDSAACVASGSMAVVSYGAGGAVIGVPPFCAGKTEEREVVVPVWKMGVRCRDGRPWWWTRRVGARRLFDGMSPRRGEKKDGGVAAGSDRIGALPDDVLRRVLNFLPAHDAVRTCVLARRWRHLWKSATVLRVMSSDDSRLLPVKALREFVYHLLLLGGGVPLDGCFFWFFGFDDEDVPRVNLWFRHAVTCKVLSLKLRIFRTSGPFQEQWLELDDLPLVSEHLTSLRLFGVRLGRRFLDFSSCPALKYLVLQHCKFRGVKKISSESLDHLYFFDCISMRIPAFAFMPQVYFFCTWINLLGGLRC